MSSTLAASRAEADTVAAFEAVGISYTYPYADQAVFSQIDIRLEEGQILGILGNNGAGKSTILDIFAGIIRPDSGAIQIDGTNLASLKRNEVSQRIAYVTQRQTVPRLRVYDEVLLGRKPYISWTASEYDREVVACVIASLNLEKYTNRYCDELSGGERQKVFIARALAQEPHILVLDEPTSALDPKNQIEVMQAVQNATRQNALATVIVMHDINLAFRFCDRYVFMRDGKVIAEGDGSVITEESLFSTYDVHFSLIEKDGIKLAAPLSILA